MPGGKLIEGISRPGCTGYGRTMPGRRSPRHVAVAIPAKDEAACIGACLTALDTAAARHDGPVTALVLANDCADDTVAVLQRFGQRHLRLAHRSVSLLAGSRHAGWARRLALDAAADLLADETDVLMCTDADTCVAPDWIGRTLTHLDAGADAVAGRALVRRHERIALGLAASRRLNQIGRYYVALDWLRARGREEVGDPWPRHYYEGGASIALSLAMYRRIGGCPTPPVGEDRALFGAVRAAGGRVRHPLDVRVFTSGRLHGRAAGGMADAFARWIEQDEDAPLHEVYALPRALQPDSGLPGDQLSFRTLPAALAQAGALIRAARATPPQVQPIGRVALGRDDVDRVAE